MNNLSLQTAQNTSVKKMSDSANKLSENAGSTTATALNSPFQNMLNKQVQAQQSPAKQAVVKRAEFKQAAHKSAEFKPAKLMNKADNAQTLAEAKLKAANQTSATASMKNADNKNLANASGAEANPNAAALDTVKFDAKDLLNANADGQSALAMLAEAIASEARASEASASVAKRKAEANLNDIAATPLASAMNMIPLLNNATNNPANNQLNGQALTSAANATAQTLLASDGTTAMQRNLAAALANTLQQAKSAHGSNADSQLMLDDKASMDNNNWLEAMLPGNAKQALGDESANAKLILKALNEGIVKDGAGKEGLAKDVSAKDAAIKEITQPGSFQPAAPMNATATAQQVASSNNINIYPGKTGWDQAISQKVVWMVGANEQSATLTLNPPDLGPLQVVIHVHNDQVDTRFISDNAEVRQALEDGLSNLRDKMNESGIQLGQTNVSAGEQSQQPFQQAMQQGFTASQRSKNSATETTEIAGGANAVVRVSNGLVDTFA